MTAWEFNPALTFEQAGSDWIVLDADAGVVLRASGSAAHVLTAIAAPGTATDADLLPAHLDDTMAALAERGVIVATAGMSRRRLISTGALAAGAATLATSAGIHTLILPTAASAASPSATLDAPTGVTATPGESQQIIVNWTNVGGATSYEVFYRIFGSSDPYTEFVPPSPPITTGPVTVTGLTNTTNYDFYVVAVNATSTSEPSTPLANATAAVPPGSTWTIRSTPADNDWRSVTYGMIDSSVTSDASGTLVPGFVAVAVAEPGTGNRVMTSPDGINWTSRNAAQDNDWQGVTYGNGVFVAVSGSGSANRVMTSPDSITWTIRTSAADNSWRSVTYGSGRFVAVSSSGANNRVMTGP